MKCPMCEQPVKFLQPECGCGELLTQWWTLVKNGRAARQHGLTLAAAGDYLGACLAFLEDALANPLERQSLVDAAKALIHLGRLEDGLRLLRIADGDPRAAAVMQAIETLQASAQAKASAPPETPQAAEAPATSAVPEPVAPAPAPAAAPRTLNPFLALGPLDRSVKKALGLSKGRREISDGWKWVLVLEQHHEGSLDVVASSLDAWKRTAVEPALAHYVDGLRAWQRGQRPAAHKEFQASLAENAPVLNPALYYLHLHLHADDTAAQGWQQLAQWTSADERQRCRSLLERMLASWKDEAGLLRLRSLTLS